MQARVASMEDTKEARLAAVDQGSLFQMGMLKVFIGFLLLVVGLSTVGMYSVHITREEMTGPSPIQREEEGTARQGGKAGRALGHLLRALTPVSSGHDGDGNGRSPWPSRSLHGRQLRR